LKKNQKTFKPFANAAGTTVRIDKTKSFLVLFFKKELLPCLLDRDLVRLTSAWSDHALSVPPSAFRDSRPNAVAQNGKFFLGAAPTWLFA
jgi:hypothetical protein